MSVPPTTGNILVCGGAGYIGAHMCKMLSARGFTVAVLDDLSGGHEAAVRWGPFYKGSIGDPTVVEAVFTAFRPSAVFHFAGKIAVAESVADPALYYANNVAATLVLLDQIRRTPGCALVFSSTAAIFGLPQGPRIGESHPQAPINPYGRSKLLIEQLLPDYYRAYGLPSIALRYFNAAGADAEGDIGESHAPETHLIPLVLEAAAGRRAAVQIYGDDYETPDGTCIRDYIHVNDLCAAHLLGLQRLRESPGAYAYNLGNGQGFSVREVIAAAEHVTARVVPYDVAARRPGDPARLVADAGKAQRELGWHPQHTELQPIIASAWNWQQNRRY